jgi:hypothetical protein
MQTFKDSNNRNWSITLSIGTAMKVKERLGVDLLQPEVGEPPLLTRLGTDELLLAETLAILLEDQFATHKMDPQQVYDCFDGPTFMRAHEAFYMEMIDFFRQRGRDDRARAVEKQRSMIEAGVRAAITKIEEIDVDKVLEEALRQ